MIKTVEELLKLMEKQEVIIQFNKLIYENDYDGVDETHWIPGQGVYDWDEILTCIRQLDKEVLLILETTIQLSRKARFVDPYFIIRQNERACFIMENYKRLSLESENFVIPQ